MKKDLIFSETLHIKNTFHEESAQTAYKERKEEGVKRVSISLNIFAGVFKWKFGRSNEPFLGASGYDLTVSQPNANFRIRIEDGAEDE